MHDPLFQLIKSLTAGEKRYFKLVAAKQTDGRKTNYLKLFDAYNDLPEKAFADEKEFQLELKRQNLGKYLSDEKNYLTELIMKAMRLHAGEKKAEGKLADMIQEINFLEDKGLLEQCSKIIQKAWTIAEERELTEDKIKLLQIKRRIDKQDYNAMRESYQKELRNHEEITIEQLRNESEASYLREQLYNIYVTSQMQTRAEEVGQIYEQLDNLQKRSHLTFAAMHHIISAKCNVLDNRKEYRAGMDLLKHMISLWESSSFRIEETPDKYVKLLSHIIVLTFRAEEYQELPPLIAKLQQVKTSEKDVLKDIFFLSTTAQLFNYINNNQFIGALEMIPGIREGLDKYKSLLSFVQKRVLSSNICLIYFKNKMYSEVLDAIQDVYTLIGRSKEKQHKLEDIKVYEFIAHYELGNIELLHYTVRNNQRYFKDHQPDNQFVENVWRLFKQLIQTPGKPKTAKQELMQQVAELECPENNIALKNELLSWLA